MYEELAVLAAFTFIYSVISGRVEKMATSGPIISRKGLLCRLPLLRSTRGVYRKDMQAQRL
jgi:hypothetical protein